MNTLRKTAMSAMGVLSKLAFQVLMLAMASEAKGAESFQKTDGCSPETNVP